MLFFPLLQFPTPEQQLVVDVQTTLSSRSTQSTGIVGGEGVGGAGVGGGEGVGCAVVEGFSDGESETEGDALGEVETSAAAVAKIGDEIAFHDVP